MAVPKKADPGAMDYAVTRRGKDGEETVVVSAVSGDEAASKAFKAGTIIVCITPHVADEAGA